MTTVSLWSNRNSVTVGQLQESICGKIVRMSLSNNRNSVTVGQL